MSPINLIKNFSFSSLLQIIALVRLGRLDDAVLKAEKLAKYPRVCYFKETVRGNK